MSASGRKRYSRLNWPLSTDSGQNPNHIKTMTNEKNYSGIAVNERLYEAGLLDDFFKAANKKDRDKMIALLRVIELDKSQAEEFADATLKNWAFSG